MLTALALAATLAASPETRTYTVEGVSRSALIYAPAKASASPPLVFGFHGHGGNMRQAARSFRLHETFPEAVVVYMDGLPTPTPNDPKGERRGWQVAPRLLGDRDLKFFDAVYTDVTARFSADRKSVFAMGHSNGGRFTYVLWAERGDRFAAYAPSGSPASGLKLRPAPVFHICGEADRLVEAGKQKKSLEEIKVRNGCAAEGKRVADYITRYPGKDGNDVVAWIHPGGHQYPRSAPERVADFFRSVLSNRK